MKGAGGAVAAFLLLMSSFGTVGVADGAIFVRGTYGWMENDMFRTSPGGGSPYLGGGGKSAEIGFEFGSIGFSGELGPSYDQPNRNVPQAKAIGVTEHGKYKLMIGNFSYKLEPIDNVQPYIQIGLGQSSFDIDYGKGLRVGNRTLTSDRMKATVIGFGFGFEAPIRSWLLGGVRGRYLYDRWKAKTDAGISPKYVSGNGYTVEATLKVRI
jgi:hypothetical protein